MDIFKKLYNNKCFSVWMLVVLWAFSVTLTSCKRKPKDGHYCAKVAYQKEDSKKQGTFTIIVEIKDNHLTDISFPDGHYDTSQIKPIEIPTDGNFTAVSNAGHIYKIQMQGPAEECMKASNMVQCKGNTAAGKRCQRYTDSKSGLCWQHNKK